MKRFSLALAALLLLSCASGPSTIDQAGPREPCAETRTWQPTADYTVLIWNLGFGGLGEGAEFFPDGGHRLIPSSRREVGRYVEGIGRFVASVGADVCLFQEAALPSAVNRRADLLAALAARLPGRWSAYSPEVRICFPRVSVGAATFSPGPPRVVERLELPRERGGARQFVHLLVARFLIPGGELVIGNLHLSAFDEGASARHRQLEAVAEFLLAEQGQGHQVVLGGDWNLLLAATDFPHTTEERYLSWIQPLPPGFPPPGFRLAVDPSVPTVRTLERPYVRGQNYTAVIDGFLVSANIEVLWVRTFDLGFRFSDHQPVLLRLALE